MSSVALFPDLLQGARMELKFMSFVFACAVSALSAASLVLFANCIMYNLVI